MNATTHGFKDETVVNSLPDKIEPRMPDEKLDLRAVAMVERATAFVCASPDDYKVGDRVVSECASLVKRIKEIHDPICDATNKAHKAATGGRKKLIDPINQASKIIDDKLGNFKMKHDRQVAEEQRLLEEEARKEQEDHALTQAAQMEKEGLSKEVIEAVLETANDPVRVAAPLTPALTSNNSRTIDWDIEIVDKVLVPWRYMNVNEAAIRAAVRAAKGDIKISGVKVIETFKTRRKAL